MIAHDLRLPVLQSGHCVVTSYDVDWLVTVLEDAAKKAEVSLPFKREIAAGVLVYLAELYPLPSIPLEFLFDRLRQALKDMGLPLIADHLVTQTPPVDINLGKLARQTPLPLFFYTELKEMVERMRCRGITRYHFQGNEECSMLLGDKRRHCPAQQRELRELNACLQAISEPV